MMIDPDSIELLRLYAALAHSSPQARIEEYNYTQEWGAINYWPGNNVSGSLEDSIFPRLEAQEYVLIHRKGYPFTVRITIRGFEKVLSQRTGWLATDPQDLLIIEDRFPLAQEIIRTLIIMAHDAKSIWIGWSALLVRVPNHIRLLKYLDLIQSDLTERGHQYLRLALKTPQVSLIDLVSLIRSEMTPDRVIDILVENIPKDTWPQILSGMHSTDLYPSLTKLLDKLKLFHHIK